MADDWKERRKPADLARLTPEVRAKLVAEYADLIDRADLSGDEVVILVHILTHAGCTEDGSFFLPAYAILWGAVASYIPPADLPPERTREALRFLKRRGVLREIDTEDSLAEDTPRVASVIDRSVLAALAVKAP